MNPHNDNGVALITGASSGIGATMPAAWLTVATTWSSSRAMRHVWSNWRRGCEQTPESRRRCSGPT